jgi:hypothetical protein
MEAIIREKKPHLKDASVYNMVINIQRLYRDLFGTTDYDISKFNDTSLIVEYLKDKPINTIMTYYTYLYTITGLEFYKTENGKLKKIRDGTDLPASDAEHTISEAEIKEKFAELKKQSNKIYKNPITKEGLLVLQNAILIGLMGDMFMAPRRSKDYTEMLLKGKADDKNYIEKGEFVFNVYKTDKIYGQQRIKIPTILKKMIDAYREVSPHEYLFTTLFGKQLQSIGARLNEIFGRPIGVNSMRRNSLKEFRPFLEQKKKINEKMTLMGSSIKELPHYTR